MFIISNSLVTLIRCGKSAYLGIVKATHLLWDGPNVHCVCQSEIVITDTKIEIRSQVLAFKEQEMVWTWTGNISRLCPLSKDAKESQAHDMLVVDVPGIAACPLTMPVSDNWTLPAHNLQAILSRIWTRITLKQVHNIAACSGGDTFPLHNGDGA
jgi:hypothetical protein